MEPAPGRPRHAHLPPRPDSTPPPRRARHSSAPAWTKQAAALLRGRAGYALLGLLVPFAVVVRHAANLPPSFDGGMNLQVAANLVEGSGYVRQFGPERLFPYEIETSGPYIFLAAAFIKVFGISLLSLQAANLVFVAALLGIISWLVRSSRAALLLAPSLVLLALPGMQMSLSGYGEVPIATCILGAFTLMGAVMQGARRPLLLSSLAFILIGLAFTIKIIGLAGAPVAAVGLVLMMLAQPQLPKLKLLATSLAAALPVGAFELYRLRAFGSVQTYLADWQEQADAVGYQSGLTVTKEQSKLAFGADHIHLLSRQTGIGGELLALLLVAPLVTVAVVFLLRRTSWRSWLTGQGRGLSVLLSCYIGLYLTWWVFITPTEKAWLRRLLPGLLSLNVLYLVLIGWALVAVRRYLSARSVTATAAAVTTGALVFALAAPASAVAAVAAGNGRALLFGNGPDQDGEPFLKAVAAAQQLHAEGRVLFGGGWWSAPAISVVAGIELEDLMLFDACSPQGREIAMTGKAVLVWDRSARIVVNEPHPNLPYTFTEIARPSPDATFYEMRLKDGICPAA